MKILTPLILIAVGSMACQTSPYYARNQKLTVSDATLVHVPVDNRSDIEKARSECAKEKDLVLVAQRNIDEAQERLSLAKHEVSIAQEEVQAAEKRMDVAEGSSQESRDQQMKDAQSNMEAVRAHLRFAESQVVFQESQIDQLKARKNLAEMRVDLADARAELAKAKAVNELKRTDIKPYDLMAFDCNVSDKEVAVAMAEVDAEAWEKKIKLRQEALVAQEKAVPASYRDSWRKVDNTPVKE